MRKSPKNVWGELTEHAVRKLECFSVDRAGFVARPLYVCTKCIYGDQLCMKVASMSKFIPQAGIRRLYRCTKCVREDTGFAAPVPDSVFFF